MAYKIQPTPVLSGKAAKDFLKRLADDEAYRQTPEGKEETRKEIERLKSLYEELKPIIKDAGF